MNNIEKIKELLNLRANIKESYDIYRYSNKTWYDRELDHASDNLSNSLSQIDTLVDNIVEESSNLAKIYATDSMIILKNDYYKDVLTNITDINISDCDEIITDGYFSKKSYYKLVERNFGDKIKLFIQFDLDKDYKKINGRNIISSVDDTYIFGNGDLYIEKDNCLGILVSSNKELVKELKEKDVKKYVKK